MYETPYMNTAKQAGVLYINSFTYKTFLTICKIENIVLSKNYHKSKNTMATLSYSKHLYYIFFLQLKHIYNT